MADRRRRKSSKDVYSKDTKKRGNKKTAEGREKIFVDKNKQKYPNAEQRELDREKWLKSKKAPKDPQRPATVNRLADLNEEYDKIEKKKLNAINEHNKEIKDRAKNLYGESIDYEKSADKNIEKQKEFNKARTKEFTNTGKLPTSSGNVNTSSWEDWGKAMDEQTQNIKEGKPSKFVNTPKNAKGANIPKPKEGVGSKKWSGQKVKARKIASDAAKAALPKGPGYAEPPASESRRAKEIREAVSDPNNRNNKNTTRRVRQTTPKFVSELDKAKAAEAAREARDISKKGGNLPESEKVKKAIKSVTDQEIKFNNTTRTASTPPPKTAPTPASTKKGFGDKLNERIENFKNRNIAGGEKVSKGLSATTKGLGKALKFAGQVAKPLAVADIFYGDRAEPFEFRRSELSPDASTAEKTLANMGDLGGTILDWSPSTFFTDPLSGEWIPGPDENVRRAGQNIGYAGIKAVRKANAALSGEAYVPTGREYRESEEFQRPDELVGGAKAFSELSSEQRKEILDTRDAAIRYRDAVKAARAENANIKMVDPSRVPQKKETPPFDPNATPTLQDLADPDYRDKEGNYRRAIKHRVLDAYYGATDDKERNELRDSVFHSINPPAGEGSPIIGGIDRNSLRRYYNGQGTIDSPEEGIIDPRKASLVFDPASNSGLPDAYNTYLLGAGLNQQAPENMLQESVESIPPSDKSAYGIYAASQGLPLRSKQGLAEFAELTGYPISETQKQALNNGPIPSGEAVPQTVPTQRISQSLANLNNFYRMGQLPLAPISYDGIPTGPQAPSGATGGSGTTPVDQPGPNARGTSQEAAARLVAEQQDAAREVVAQQTARDAFYQNRFNPFGAGSEYEQLGQLQKFYR